MKKHTQMMMLSSDLQERMTRIFKFCKNDLKLSQQEAVVVLHLCSKCLADDMGMVVEQIEVCPVETNELPN